MSILTSIVLAVLMVSPNYGHKTLWNCEDKDVTPCYTYDEGAWKVVKSYTPYKASKVKLCKTFRSVPCLMPEKSGKRVYVWHK